MSVVDTPGGRIRGGRGSSASGRTDRGKERTMNVASRAVALLVLGVIATSAWAQSGSARELLGALRAGGYVIVVRHGATHSDQADTDPLNPANVGKQRQLNDKGRADARAMGDALRAAGAPIGTSYSS